MDFLLTKNSNQVLLSIGTVAALVYFLSGRRRQLRKIPGPAGIPLFGNALQLQAAKPHLKLSDWAEEHGDIMRINLFGEDIVVVNSYEGITDMLVTKSIDFAGRPVTFRTQYLSGIGNVSFSDFSPKWNIMKKCAMKGLKQVGDQLTDLEGIVAEVMDGLMTELSSFNNEPVDVRNILSYYVAHITFTLVYGHKMTVEEHNQFAEMQGYINERLSPKAEHAILDIIPWTRGPWYSKFREFREIADRYKVFREFHLDRTLQRFHANEITCASDSFINEMKHPSSARVPPVTLTNVQSAALDLILAGIKTTTSALYYFIALMASRPEVQEEAYQQIIDVIGHRPPTFKDRFSIPYVESMFLEMLRLMSHVPFALPHKTMADTTLLGYDIPKDTQVWANLWQLHHDENLWDQPWEFKPKRFLDDQGKLINPDHPLRKQFFAFGAGRRSCAGEMLARNRTFLFLVNLLQRFRMIKPEGENVKCDPRQFRIGLVLFTDFYKVQFEPRM